ncbi:lipase 1-like isoform X2 [Cotesia glomerata]|uniref:lipase 1-like isoform X2 n=1 Tax=Cotesia glomerata TaxID=32391 RepID=UPI001D02AD48|nr:lipase 1-like isoform X2 [Cotesia glomerata]
MLPRNVYVIFLSLLGFSTNDVFESWPTTKLIERDGYYGETHNVTTEDGFILSLHRIPGKLNSTPVLLIHGLLCTSALWVVLGKEKSLAYLLADEGYDVWLANSRGSSYSMSHVNLTTDDFEFWDFSYNEMGIYDLPAMIDYITSIVNDKIIIIGHSQGTMQSFIMESERPEMTEKIKGLICLAPIAFLGHVEWRIKNIGPVLAKIANFFRNFGLLNSFGVQTLAFKTILSFGCKLFKIQNYFCQNIYYSIIGFEDHQFNSTLLNPILDNYPAGTSFKNLIHFSQDVEFNVFAKYDYGEGENLKIYNSSKPPDYDLSKVTSPTALIYSKADWYSNPTDVEALIDVLPNIIDVYVVDHPKFTHMDFLWAIDAKSLLYDHVIDLVKKFSN